MAINDGYKQYGFSYAGQPSTVQAVPHRTLDEVYQGVLGRAGEAAGLDYWKGQFGDSVDANEYDRFVAAARPEMARADAARAAAAPPSGGAVFGGTAAAPASPGVAAPQAPPAVAKALGLPQPTGGSAAPAPWETGGVKPAAWERSGVYPAPAQAPAPWETGGVYPAPAQAGAAYAREAAPAAAPKPTSVAELYTGILGRAGTQADSDYWGAKFGAEIDDNERAEFLAAAQPEFGKNLSTLYQQNFGRDADTAGLEWWQGEVGKGKYTSMEELNQAFVGGMSGEDVKAKADGAQYGAAWNSGLSADSPQLVYNAEQDRWEIKRKDPSGQGGGTTYNADLNRQVDPLTMTIEGRINNIMARDASGNYTNPVIQQAAMRARQAFAGRGLLNSSMSEQAALEAVTAKAIEIAGPDAQTYFAQGRANQDATNVFARDEQNYKYDLSKMDKTQGYDLAKMAAANGYDLGKMGAANGYDLAKMAAANGYDLTKMAAANGYDVAKTDQVQGYENSRLDKQLGLERDRLAQSGSQFNQELKYKYDALNLSEANRADATTLAHDRALEINNITAVNSAYELYLRRISDIDSNTTYDDKTKIQMKNSAGKDFDLYAQAKGIVWKMGLGDRFTSATAAPAGAAPTGGVPAGSGAGLLQQQSAGAGWSDPGG